EAAPAAQPYLTGTTSVSLRKQGDPAVLDLPGQIVAESLDTDREVIAQAGVHLRGSGTIADRFGHARHGILAAPVQGDAAVGEGMILEHNAAVVRDHDALIATEIQGLRLGGRREKERIDEWLS